MTKSKTTHIGAVKALNVLGRASSSVYDMFLALRSLADTIVAIAELILGIIRATKKSIQFL